MSLERQEKRAPFREIAKTVWNAPRFVRSWLKGKPTEPLKPPSQAEGIEFAKERTALMERWKNLHRRITAYNPGIYDDGTVYSSGKLLEFYNGDYEKPEQVMDTFERPWADATVNAMFAYKRGAQNVLERGFGLGLMSDAINQKLKVFGGTHTIIELNKEVFEDAKKWAIGKLEEAKKEGREMRITFKGNREKHEEREEQTLEFTPQTTGPSKKAIEIVVINGDADEELAEFPKQSFDLIFSDTHQLIPAERGINDLLRVDEIDTHLKPNGRFTFCAFHRDNPEGNLDIRQHTRISPYFRYSRDTVPVVVPPHCTYLRGPTTRLPVVVCEKSRF